MLVKRFKNATMTIKLEESDVINKDYWKSGSDYKGVKSEIDVEKLYTKLFPIHGLRLLKEPGIGSVVIIDDTEKGIRYTKFSSTGWLDISLLSTYKGKVMKLGKSTGWRVNSLHS